LDLMLVPSGLLLMVAYHVWLWHRVRTQPHTTIIGTNSTGRRSWVTVIMKVCFVNLINIMSYLSYLGFEVINLISHLPNSTL